ncbi:hypothetical protein ACFP81_12700 [Deinococcus lacus]|uniref:Sucrose phosphatase-like domain-containing protein n=1 Tax=Deinococcus lacus TaxID=392561 RepID=A0ABW1YEL3_9DEIO
MSGLVAFADLDDTLFQTLRKLPGVDRAHLTPATLDTRGEPHSFSTPAQTALLEWLACGGATLIPVTGRDPQALGRVTLPLTSWRVADHGLTILTPGGELDQEWAAQVAAALQPLQPALTSGHAQMTEWAAQAGCRVTQHSAAGLPFMTVVKHPAADPEPLAALRERWQGWLDTAGADLRLIGNANNLSLLPASLGKRAAVEYLRRKHFGNAQLVLGLGDSVSDLDFMAACDFAVTPSQSQLLRAALAAELPQR